MPRGRCTGEMYAQELKLRSRSPRFVPFEWGRGTSSRSGSGAGPDLESGSGSGPGPGNTPVGAGGGDGDSNGGETTSAATSEPQTGESRGQEQDCDDEIVMSSTAYPGQEWRPATLGQRGYF